MTIEKLNSSYSGGGYPPNYPLLPAGKRERTAVLCHEIASTRKMVQRQNTGLEKFCDDLHQTVADFAEAQRVSDEKTKKLIEDFESSREDSKRLRENSERLRENSERLLEEYSKKSQESKRELEEIEKRHQEDMQKSEATLKTCDEIRQGIREIEKQLDERDAVYAAYAALLESTNGAHPIAPVIEPNISVLDEEPHPEYYALPPHEERGLYALVCKAGEILLSIITWPVRKIGEFLSN